MKTFKNAISHDGQRCDVFYSRADTFDDIPDEFILKAHAVCFWNGKMLLVGHSDWNIWGIPGGTREPGEAIEQTMAREIQEETNCRVVDYKPISYQKVVSPNGDVHYRVQYFCNIEPIGEFKSDPAGNVNKVLWIDPNEYDKYIECREIRATVIKQAISVYRDML
ncbi:MAG: NUDIX domain-containing protein [Candidatus Paceibacterota bacterium]|jgi:8-oxo-dGTP pyrophosphatase MutT (NUDIX family)